MATSYSNLGGSGDRRYAITPVISSPTKIPGTATQLLDGNTSSGGVYFAFGENIAGESIEFDFDTSVIIDEAEFYFSSTNNLGTWKWQGYDTSWHDIGSSFTLGGATNPQVHTQLNGNTNAYTKYRLLCSSFTGETTTVFEINFKIDVITTVSYLHPLGSGNRSATVTVTGSSGLLNGTTSIFVDGAIATGFYFNTVTLDGNQWIDFDCGADYVCTEAMFKESGAVGQGTWHWEAKIDGGSSYDSGGDLGSTFTLGGGGITDDGAYTTTLTALSGNTTAYRYYRLVSNSGSTSNGPWVFEMLFKIGTPPEAPAAGLTINEVTAETVEGSAYASVDGVAV